MKEYLEKLGFTITSEEIKSYGTYYTGIMKYNPSGFKIQINVSIVKNSKNPYISISENHYRGNMNGYIKDFSEIKTIVEVMTRDRDS